MSRMEAVLAAHRNKGLAFRNAESGALYDCSCGRRFSDSSKHLADALSAAGFGPVADAKAEALEDAARKLLGDISASSKSTKEMYNAIYAAWLNEQAAAVRSQA